jgi:hypothetical protein
MLRQLPGLDREALTVEEARVARKADIGRLLFRGI